MRIYFAYTIRGDKSRIHIAREIVSLLKQKGHHVMTELFLRDNAEDEGNLTSQEIFDRDKKWLQECDCIVSEVSGSSFGIGYELGYVLGSTHKKAFILYHKDAEHHISKMAVGNTEKNCVVFGYNDISDLKEFIEKNF